MSKHLPRTTDAGQANKIAGQTTGGRQLAGDGRQESAQLSPRLESEVHDALARALRQHKAETIAAECGVDRATIYKWAAKPSRVPLTVLDVLAAFDPDPEMLSRIAGHLMAAVSSRALARQAKGEAVSIFHQINGRWIR